MVEDIANVELRPTFVGLVDDTGMGQDVIDKLDKLQEFYRVLEPLGGKEKYSVVDARFGDQLVCTHRKNEKNI